MAKNWIKGAIKKPGALHKELGVPMDKKIPEKKLEKAEKAGGKEGKRAELAMTLKKINKRKHDCPSCKHSM
ncbi:hypothetical protein UFOVP9_53 [uncultured Caudovirales phage]|jgi:hypothetical protein|uniref:Uncharacterized protein n=1 Tax=uncultured Caudovirales phage TaxID=2100421 RepID=A0A6J5KM34_9CAUD|nr:hypothetical protein UFOVP9_53 [uncultured Caudovirales phage]